MATKESLIADVVAAEVALARAKEALAAYRPKSWWLGYHEGGASGNYRLMDRLDGEILLYPDGRIGSTGYITGHSNVILFR